MEADFSRSLHDDGAGLSDVLDALEEALMARGVPMATVSSVLIAADEILSNALNHGGASPRVELAARVADGRVTVSVTDDGEAFDPLAAEAPDTTLAIEDREIGGLGIHLVRKLMDSVHYDRTDGCNRLQFAKSYMPPSV